MLRIAEEESREMSVEDAINYSPSEEEDYYALLSCDESSTVRHETLQRIYHVSRAEICISVID